VNRAEGKPVNPWPRCIGCRFGLVIFGHELDEHEAGERPAHEMIEHHEAGEGIGKGLPRPVGEDGGDDGEQREEHRDAHATARGRVREFGE